MSKNADRNARRSPQAKARRRAKQRNRPCKANAQQAMWYDADRRLLPRFRETGEHTSV